MFPPIQAGPGLGDLVVVLFLLVAMAIPVAAVVGVALWLTRSEWAGDRKDLLDKDLDASFDVTDSGGSEPASGEGKPDGDAGAVERSESDSGG